MRTYSILLFVLILFLQSCYVSKTLERDVNISLDESFIVSINNIGNSTFVNNYNSEEYKSAFLTGMKAEFAGSHIIINNTSPEFAISISELTIDESTTTETVSDSDSPDNGKVFELTSLKLSATGIVDQIGKEHITNWSADKDKDEKVTNNRSAGQMVTGNNRTIILTGKKTFRTILLLI